MKYQTNVNEILQRPETVLRILFVNLNLFPCLIKTKKNVLVAMHGIPLES